MAARARLRTHVAVVQTGEVRRERGASAACEPMISAMRNNPLFIPIAAVLRIRGEFQG